MRLTPENKKKITKKIRAGAAATFRADGFDAVNLDRLMKEAELTRGSFYAHYKSKSALFADVMRHEHPLLHMLQRRDGKSSDALLQQMLIIFEGYLNPANLNEVFKGCSLAALTGDTTRADADVRAGFGHAFKVICAEMAREQQHAAESYAPPLVLASGAVGTAMAIEDSDQQAIILKGTWAAFQSMLPKPGQGE
ncbi:MAG: TetR/AcrR family transcriptional regulator [Pseudomonadota bacterium]